MNTEDNIGSRRWGVLQIRRMIRSIEHPVFDIAIIRNRRVGV